MLNKKAQFTVARKSIYWPIIIFTATIVILALVITLNSYQSNSINHSKELSGNLISLRFINNPYCFTYQDEITSRTYPGIIDINKFTEENLDSCYQTENKKELNFRLLLKLKNKEIMTNNYYHKDDFTISKDILIKENGHFTPEKLLIYVQTEI